MLPLFILQAKSCLITNNYSRLLIGLIACLRCEDWLRIMHKQCDGQEAIAGNVWRQRQKCIKLAKQMNVSRIVGLYSLTYSHS